MSTGTSNKIRDLPEALEKYLGPGGRNHNYGDNARRALKEGGIGTTHRILGACERDILASGLRTADEVGIERLFRAIGRWQICSGLVHTSYVYRCPIGTPYYDHPEGVREGITEDLIKKLNAAELGSKYRLLTQEEIQLAEYGRFGRFRLKEGVVEHIGTHRSLNWQPVDSVLGSVNMFSYDRVPVDLPFLLGTGVPADEDDEIPDDILRYSFFIPPPENADTQAST